MTATVERTIVGLGAGEPDEELRRGIDRAILYWRPGRMLRALAYFRNW